METVAHSLILYQKEKEEMKKRLQEEEELGEEDYQTPSDNDDRLEAIRSKQVFLLSKRRQTSDKQ